ncbi:MAG: DUF3039 domain-containing protein [Desulfurococcales archaeon]|nr:DUF3039 domain-containing protein [Desulfurococcales archaeon]
MSSELQGKEVVIDCCGSLFYAERDARGFYICPVCREAVLFSEEDLIRHLAAHARRTLKRRHRVPKR